MRRNKNIISCESRITFSIGGGGGGRGGQFDVELHGRWACSWFCSQEISAEKHSFFLTE